MKINIHQTHVRVADFNHVFKNLKEILANNNTLHLFSELYLTGYPLNDLCLQSSFIKSYQNLFKNLNDFCQNEFTGNDVALVGGLEYQLSSSNVPEKIFNVIYELKAKSPLKILYRKRLLPNYDIFDEKKYFKAGDKNTIYQINGLNLAIQICEDMWASSSHDVDPFLELHQELKKSNESLHGIINLSASPFDLDKSEKRIKRASEIVEQFKCDFIYVNKVGAEDEILFDGTSFHLDSNQKLKTLKSFTIDQHQFELTAHQNQMKSDYLKRDENSWESLFAPRLQMKLKPAKLENLDNLHCEKIVEAIIFGLQEYAAKSGFKKFLVALSGGIDSALVLTLARIGLKPGQALEAVYMPSQYSSSLSYELSSKLCENLNVPLYTFPIKFLHSTIKNNVLDVFGSPLEGLANENVQSRMRGMLLYLRSNMTGAMVLNTSNKSELAVGYSTQYGDSVGALSLIGDLYKTEIFELCSFINAKYNNLIPVEIIKRPPTAELRENQKDEDSLPPYPRLDAILEGILSYRLSMKDLSDLGFDEAEIKKVINLYTKSEYKRKQFGPILKLKSKSFGYGYRVPLTTDTNYYQGV